MMRQRHWAPWIIREAETHDRVNMMQAGPSSSESRETQGKTEKLRKRKGKEMSKRRRVVWCTVRPIRRDLPLRPRTTAQPTLAPALAAYGYKRPLASKNARLHVTPRCGARRDGHTTRYWVQAPSRVGTSWLHPTREARKRLRTFLKF